MSILEAFSRYRRLTAEQRTLLGGRGADTRPLNAWRPLLDGLVRYEGVRASGASQAAWGAAMLGVVTAVCVGIALVPPFELEEARPFLWVGGLTGVACAVVVDLALILRRRELERHLARMTLPFLRTLEDELGPDAQLYLSLRFDGAKPERGDDVHWLDGAVQLRDGSLLHFSGRDVAEPSGARTWLRATWSRPEAEVHPHVLGDDDPTVSGLTRTVADEARREGNPFTSMEMVALREAHGVQLDMLRLEAFEEQRVPPPPVGDVLGEASRGLPGGRDSSEVSAAVLEALVSEARAAGTSKA